MSFPEGYSRSTLEDISISDTYDLLAEADEVAQAWGESASREIFGDEVIDAARQQPWLTELFVGEQ